MRCQINYSRLMNNAMKVLAVVALFACQPPVQEEKEAAASEPQYDVAAYVWPSCHHDERFGDMLWPDRMGEWEVIKKGTPRFEGHYQPKVPLWEYEPDNDPKVMERWIETATDYGVNTFIFDWYWFGDGPFLESSLNDGFLKASNNEKMNFYLMWANHDVKQNYWNVHKYKDVDTLLWDGAVDLVNFKIIVDRVINNYFKKPNYYKIDGKPVFSIFSVANLVEGLGGLDEAADALNYFREETKNAGFPGLHIQLINFGVPNENALQSIKALGANSVTKYNWGGPHPEDYVQWGVESMDKRQQWDEALDIPVFPNASIGWDDSPRFPHKGKADIVHYNKTPEAFASFLQKSKEYCDSHPEQPKLITIFSWNEWIEGGYLLPDMLYGYQYLEAVKKVTYGGSEKTGP
ncbi:glycoside hydrolase family 99-like domain-containing protein [Imperialibacter roseus]|uniref:Glycoside hydrolase family 99-like domain-containing protein n=1 Tax=Imperialibacter roseus TaxID=1324217 RepID=A0ABZ0IUE2_9BACT|nr:glycoside hydrolase family 99-like domain-containing protein [Imperialibacter roseus]WOK08599.1 glycoside hydrolase family 99-like domain-containing protein [Imperialibacter roseus]